MGRAIYKPDPDLDEYLIFSTITDGPVSPVMNREQIAEEWKASCELLYGERPSDADTRRSLDRADAHGQSWKIRGTFWEDEEFVRISNMNIDSPIDMAWCQHRDLAKLTRAVAAADWDQVRELVTESETEEE